MTTTPTGIPIIDCDACGRKHPENMPHCDTCGKSSRFVEGGLCLSCSTCHQCGHPAYQHHGTDGRERSDAGCFAHGSMGREWCRCPLTATEARRKPEPQLCPPCRDTDCNACEGRTLLLDCQCAHSILEDS